jgi:FimV-like protein
MMGLALVTSICLWRGAVGNAADGYTTQRGDTLWEIAGRYVQAGHYVQEDTVTTYQMMLGLFDANPEAFINRNINLLKVGYTLRIPTREELGVPPAPPATEDDRGTAAVTAPLVAATEEADAASAMVAEDMAKLQNELALTQERAARQHAANEALWSRVEALEEKVVTLDGLTAAQNATGRDGTAATPPPPPSRMTVGWTVPNMLIIMSGMVVLGLAVIWFWRRRATATAETVVSMTPQTRAEPPAPEASEPLALGLGDLNVDSASLGAAPDVTLAAVETAAAADVALEALMIDLDDLELELVQAEGEAAELPSTAAISPKADPASPSKAC